ncbi:MAG: VOC family protein [Pseudomonadota bacterium]
MKMPHIGHVGIIVKDMDSAVAKLTALLGVPPSRLKEIPDVGLKTAEFETANLTLELLQYTDEKASFAKEVMGERPGLNHLSVTVNDVNEAIRNWTEKGLVLTEGFPRNGAHGKVAFFQTEPDTGILFEVCQPDESGGH